MPRLLDGCCGTAQVSITFWINDGRSARWIVGPSGNPTILADVRDVKPELLWIPCEWDFVWCSPPCTEFSLAKSTAPRYFAKGDSMLIACFDIIRYLTNTDKEVFWAVEDPYTGFLRKREHMVPWAPFLKRAVSCKYGKVYLKATAIWTNLDTWMPRPFLFFFSAAGVSITTGPNINGLHRKDPPQAAMVQKTTFRQVQPRG